MAVHERIRRMLEIERLCTRFHLIAGQLQSRHNNRDTLRVEDEYDIRDLLHALLILDYDDIRPETWTPDYAGGSSRIDFHLKLEKIVIEAKMACDGFTAGELGEQLRVDVQKYQQYPDCGTLICFVYDPKRCIANPRGIENELSGDIDELTVRVIIAPKRL